MEQSTFSNAQLSLSALTPYQTQESIHLEPVYIKANNILRIAFFAIVLVILAGIKWQPFSPLSDGASNVFTIALSVVAGLSLFIIVMGYLSDKAKSYTLREHDISLYSGVIFKKVTIQPFLRIQHIELKRGPVDRKLDLASIQVFSAGGALHTFELPGLKHDDALAMREYILKHKDVIVHG